MTMLDPFSLGPFARIVRVNFGGDDVLIFRAFANDVSNLGVSIVASVAVAAGAGTDFEGVLFQDYGQVAANPNLSEPWNNRTGILTHWGQKLRAETGENFYLRYSAIRLPLLRQELIASSGEEPASATFTVTRDWVAGGGLFLNNLDIQATSYRSVSNITYIDNGSGAEYEIAVSPDDPIDSFFSDNDAVDISGGDPIIYHAEESFSLNFTTLEITGA
jgi:hypothetical protein